jgi:hypothetical protein
MALNRISRFRDKLGVVTRAFFAQRSVSILPDASLNPRHLLSPNFAV